MVQVLSQNRILEKLPAKAVALRQTQWLNTIAGGPTLDHLYLIAVIKIQKNVPILSSFAMDYAIKSPHSPL